MRKLFVCALILSVGCGKPSFDANEKRTNTKCEEEEIVRKTVLHARGGGTEFVSWGPHDIKGDLGFGKHIADGMKYQGFDDKSFDKSKPIKIVRVIYMKDNALGKMGAAIDGRTYLAKVPADHLYFLQGDKVIFENENKNGDGWREALKKKLDAYK